MTLLPTFGIGPLVLWRLTGPSQSPNAVVDRLQQTKGQEYTAGFVKAFQEKSQAKKAKAVGSGALLAPYCIAPALVGLLLILL